MLYFLIVREPNDNLNNISSSRTQGLSSSTLRVLMPSPKAALVAAGRCTWAIVRLVQQVDMLLLHLECSEQCALHSRPAYTRTSNELCKDYGVKVYLSRCDACMAMAPEHGYTRPAYTPASTTVQRVLLPSAQRCVGRNPCACATHPPHLMPPSSLHP